MAAQLGGVVRHVYHLIPHAHKCSYVYHLIADTPKMFVLVAHLLDKGFNVPELCVGKTWCRSCKGRHCSCLAATFSTLAVLSEPISQGAFAEYGQSVRQAGFASR